MALRGGARRRRRVQHPVQRRDLPWRRRGVRGPLRGLPHRRGQGPLAPAPRGRRGGAGGIGGQVALPARNPRHGRLHHRRRVRPGFAPRSLLGLGVARVLRRPGSRRLRGGEHHVRRAHTLRPRPRPLPHPRARGHGPGRLRHLGHHLREEPRHLHGRARAHHRRALDHQLRGRGRHLLRGVPGVHRGPAPLPGEGRAGGSRSPRHRGRGRRGRARAPHPQVALLRRDGQPRRDRLDPHRDGRHLQARRAGRRGGLPHGR